MFLVMKVSAASTMTRPVSTIAVPSTFTSKPMSVYRSCTQLTGSFTHALIGLFQSEPADPTSCSLIDSAVLESTPVTSSIGRRIPTASRLKKS